jgi:hypothetical protein
VLESAAADLEAVHKAAQATMCVVVAAVASYEEPVLPEVEVVREVLPEVQARPLDAVLVQMLVSQVLV